MSKKKKIAVDVLVPPATAKNIAKLKKVKPKKQPNWPEPTKPHDNARHHVHAPPVTDAAVARANAAGGRETR
jgi:hypothetical protein